MFEKQWDVPRAVTRRADLDPCALPLAIAWITAQRNPGAAPDGQAERPTASQATSSTIAGTLKLDGDPERNDQSRTQSGGDRYRLLLAKMNDLKKSMFIKSNTKPLIYLPKTDEKLSKIDNDLFAFSKDKDTFVSSWRGLGRSKWKGGPVLALWPDDNHIATIADDPRTTAICVIPNKDYDISGWCYGAKPHMLGTTENELWGEYGPDVLDPVVDEALRSLTVIVNVSSKLVPEVDRVHTIRALRLLWDGGHDVVPKEIQAWALTNGWSPKGAYALRQIAEGIAAGQSLKTAKEVGPSPFDSSTLRSWRESARARYRRRNENG